MYIRFELSLRDHPKIKRAAKSLGIPKAHFLGHLGTFWLWCLSVAPDGDVSSFDDEDLEEGAEWEGEPGAFARELKSRKLLDVFDTGVFVHDWEIYSEHLKARDRKRKERERKKQGEAARRHVTSQDVTGRHNNGHARHADQRGTERNRSERKGVNARARETQPQIKPDQTRETEIEVRFDPPKTPDVPQSLREVDWRQCGIIFGKIRKRYGHGGYVPLGAGRDYDQLSRVSLWANEDADEWTAAQMVEISAVGFCVSANDATIAAKYNPAFWWGDPGAFVAAGLEELKRWDLKITEERISAIRQSNRRDDEAIREIEALIAERDRLTGSLSQATG